ncbi:HET domain-containing protein [Fusarium falciforme]|uniref:HET domain-containing protein n=1 Tax=Fusarium falciforme TaxID=195108 RepID=UPI0022FFF82B|nr:HET domain-containing protein [Fusarium falciforme]WAO88951.1 HET domain-containing protein [Fusarium falciforme]
MASAQDITEGEQLLETLWREPGRAELRCLLCQEPFTDDALIRTFRVEPPGDHSPSYSIVVPTHKGDILFFDRHMSCVAEHQVRFSAVSHVWDSSISHVQRQRQTVPQTPVAARNVLDISTKVYSGTEQAKDTAGELWLAYLSVPQWSDTLKNSIIRITHKLFTTAETTVIYFGDVDSDVVKQLYRKERSPERLAAVISVCNSQYFKRVWTAMEFIGSGRVRMMTSDCTYFGDLDDPAFFNRLYDVWNEELRHHAQAQRLEAEVQMGKNGKNQVPWSLGALREAKDLKRVNFAMGSTLLKEGMPRPGGLPPCPERHSPCELSHSDEL